MIKFGIELITVGQHVTQHKHKFNKTPKFCLALGFSPLSSPQNPPLPISSPSENVSRGARVVVSTIQTLTCNSAIVLSQQAKNLILCPQSYYMATCRLPLLFT